MNEVLAAAKRARANQYGKDGNYRQALYDFETIASAALAEGKYLEDDGEKLTRGWLVSIGAVAEDHPVKVTFANENGLPIGLWQVDDGWKVMLVHHEHAASCIRRGLHTRGQLRSLLAALGVKGAE